MVVADVFYREDGAVLLGLTVFGPKGWVTGRADRRHAQNHDRSALVVVDEGPKLAQALGHRPLGDDVLSRFRVTLLN